MKSAILRKTVLLAAMAWALAMLGLGGLGCIASGLDETPLGLIEFAITFVLPLAASIAAWWMPRVAGTVLLLSAAALFCTFRSRADVFRVVPTTYFWPNILFGVLFFTIGRFTLARTPSA